MYVYVDEVLLLTNYCKESGNLDSSGSRYVRGSLDNKVLVWLLFK